VGRRRCSAPSSGFGDAVHCMCRGDDELMMQLYTGVSSSSSSSRCADVCTECRRRGLI